MRLRKPCEHGRYDGHPVIVENHADYIAARYDPCPGGEFLADAKEGELIWANDVTYDRRIYLDDGTDLEVGRYLFVLCDEMGQ